MSPTLLADIMKELEKGGMGYVPHPFIMIHHEYIYDEYIMWGNAIIQANTSCKSIAFYDTLHQWRANPNLDLDSNPDLAILSKPTGFGFGLDLCILTLLLSQKILMLLVFWGLFRPQTLTDLPTMVIRLYVTYETRVFQGVSPHYKVLRGQKGPHSAIVRLRRRIV